MTEITCVLNYIHYPVAIARYFHEAFLRRDDCKVYSVGPYTGTSIPWNGGMQIASKYLLSPTVPLPTSFISDVRTPPQIALAALGVEPDLWVNIDAGYNVTRPSIRGKVVNIFTDPHVLNYDFQRTQADANYNMQACYSQPGDVYLPYCADSVYHAPLEREKEYDVCLIGLQYNNRVALMNKLQGLGLNIYSTIGKVYDEYQEIYAKSKIAFSWSSRDDLIARVFEAGMMNLPLVTNRVTDLNKFFSDDDCYIFEDMTQAVSHMTHILGHYDEATEKAKEMHTKVKENHTYDHRVAQILGDL